MRGNGNTSIFVRSFNCRKSPVSLYSTATVALNAGSESFPCALSWCSDKNALMRSGNGTSLIGDDHADRLGEIWPFSSMMATLAARDIRSNMLNRRGFARNGTAPSTNDILNTKSLMFGGLLGLGCPNLSMFASICARMSGLSLRRPSSSCEIFMAITSFSNSLNLSGENFAHLSGTFSFSSSITHPHNSSGNNSGLKSDLACLQCLKRNSSTPNSLILILVSFSSIITDATCIISGISFSFNFLIPSCTANTLVSA